VTDDGEPTPPAPAPVPPDPGVPVPAASPPAAPAPAPSPGAAGAGPGSDGESGPGIPDVGRRRFFRLLAADAIQTAAQVVGVAAALQRTSAEAAASLLEDGTTTAVVPASAPTPPSAHRSPFRMEASALYILDQGRFPFESVEIECQSGAEASRAIREMSVRGAPAIAQVAAYALALTAERTRDAKPYVRLATLRGTANSLAGARIAPVALRAAVDRMLARMTAVGELVEDGGPIADALRAEADAIAMEATLDHARLVEAGRGELVSLVQRAELAVADEPLAGEPATPAERPLGVLTLGSTGALSGGQIGTALGVAIAYHASGRPVHVHVLESRPGLDGARLAAWELAQAGVPHTVLADAAVGWLLSRGGIDAILLGADRIALDGSVLGSLGTLQAALAGASAHVPVLVCAPGTAIDSAAGDLADLPDETRPPIELMRVRGVDVSAPGTPWLDPLVDVTPAEVVDGFVTEAGVIRRPFGPALADLAAAVAARRPEAGPTGRDALAGRAADDARPR
jgi:methylthioribose-1-phosphate isomerase